ncbi:MAG: PIN domain-containing protein [Bacteroidetes bacterium]|nr:MAG: PIN domain-containing protein [Bacteroidota bacterium]TAG85836.1 MAG: PIN domain-containing protein [Bacteroidota bacterium]
METFAWLDANILIDFLTQRGDFGEDATAIFALGEQRKIKLCLSVLSFVNTEYVLRSKHYKIAEKDIKDAFEQLLTFVEVVGHLPKDVTNALNSEFQDFEDAVQYFSAYNASFVTCLITRNKEDFAKTSLPVYTPKEFLAIHLY